MALIKCEECGHEVSDKASACPNCGCPIESVGAIQEEVMDVDPPKKKGWIWALIVAAFLCLLGGGYYGYAHFANSEDEDSMDEADSINVDNNKYAIVELTPEFIKALKVYDELAPFSEGCAAVKRDGKWGYINTKGEEIIPCKYEEADVFREGCAKVKKNTETSYINIKGEEVIPKTINRKAESEKDNLYEVFSINDENNYGLKDANGNIVINAVYDGIDIGKGLWANERSGTISNGVVLVILDEIKDTYDNTDGEPTMDDVIRHYGYADLKGNDTFSDILKEQCKKSKEFAFHQNEYEANMQSEWLQGRWIGRDTNSGYPIEVIISGNNMIQKINGQECYNGPYEYNGDMLIYNNANDFWPVDRENKVLTFGGLPMRKENGGSSAYSSSDSYSDRGSSNDNSYRFSTAYDVIGYLAGKTFHDVDGGGSLQIRENGVFVNGRCMTGAPKVISYSSYNATVSANIIPQGNITFNVDSENGTIRDSFGNRYR